MPVKVPLSLPAIEELKKENIDITKFINSCDGHTLRIGVLNLMPLKSMTETDLIRIISNSPIDIELVFVDTDSHESKNTSSEHIKAFYKKFSEIKNTYYDGFIITGAPVEKLDFEDVEYWDELKTIFDWTKTHSSSTLYICWAAFAGLYYKYGIPKYVITKKISGVFKHRLLDKTNPILRGFDDEFYVPHSRFSEVRRDDIEKISNLIILSDSDDSGVYIISEKDGNNFYITGHSEYSPMTLDFEYHRDLEKGKNPTIPVNYYPNDDPSQIPVVRWRSHANLLFTNWINYFVNQSESSK